VLLWLCRQMGWTMQEAMSLTFPALSRAMDMVAEQVGLENGQPSRMKTEADKLLAARRFAELKEKAGEGKRTLTINDLARMGA